MRSLESDFLTTIGRMESFLMMVLSCVRSSLTFLRLKSKNSYFLTLQVVLFSGDMDRARVWLSNLWLRFSCKYSPIGCLLVSLYLLTVSDSLVSFSRTILNGLMSLEDSSSRMLSQEFTVGVTFFFCCTFSFLSSSSWYNLNLSLNSSAVDSVSYTHLTLPTKA